MKNTVRILIVLFVGIFIISSHGQNSDFDRISLEEFREGITGTSDGSLQRTMIRKALATGRKDLIHACWNSGGTVEYTRDEILALPDGVPKDAILLMLLRTYPRMWPDPQRVRFGGGLAEYMREPYFSLIRKYLPDVTPDESLIATPALRLAFADRLEAAMAGKAPPSSQGPQNTDPPPSARGLPPSDKTAVTNPAFTLDRGSNLSPLWWIAAGTALAVLLLIAFKKRSS